MEIDEKQMTEEEMDFFVKQLSKKLEKEFGIKATPGRKRPRNPQERETLLRWERERGGEKIGEI